MTYFPTWVSNLHGDTLVLCEHSAPYNFLPVLAPFDDPCLNQLFYWSLKKEGWFSISIIALTFISLGTLDTIQGIWVLFLQSKSKVEARRFYTKKFEEQGEVTGLLWNWYQDSRVPMLFVPLWSSLWGQLLESTHSSQPGETFCGRSEGPKALAINLSQERIYESKQLFAQFWFLTLQATVRFCF